MMFILYMFLSFFGPKQDITVARLEIRVEAETGGRYVAITDWNPGFFQDNPEYVFHTMFETYVKTYGYEYSREVIDFLEGQDVKETQEKIRKF